MTIERPMPAAIEAERFVLGCILLESEKYDEAAQKLEAEDFALDSHKRIFGKIGEMIALGQTVDVITLQESIGWSNLGSVGGISYVMELTAGIPKRLSIASYLDIVREKSRLRKIIELCNEATARAYEQSDDDDSEAIIGQFDQELLSIAGSEGNEWPDLEKQSHEEMERINRMRSGERQSFYDYGIFELDLLLGGLAKKEMTVLGGRPNQGKTPLMTQVMVRHARRGTPVHIFTPEMTVGQLLNRIWAAESGVAPHKLRNPERMSNEEHQRVVRAMAEVSSWPMIIDDAPSLTVDEMISRARIGKRKQKTEIVGLDYLQKLHFKENAKHRFLEVSDAAVKLARLCKEEDLALLVLSSLTEGGEKNQNRPPTLLDLRMSGDIQFEASTVVLLHREIDDATRELKSDGTLLVAKSRHSAQGKASVVFNPDKLIFEGDKEDVLDWHRDN